MFSCYRASRLTYDRLERPLFLYERIKLHGHLFICRHCRTHDRQVQGLALLIQMKREAEDQPSSVTIANSTPTGLSEAARSRIAGILTDRFPAP